MSVVSPFLATYLLVVSISLWILATILYLQDRASSELRFTALMLVSVGAIALAFDSLLWMDVRFAGTTGKTAPTYRYAESANGGTRMNQ